jgi:AcrR family transcriptional regulator
MTTTEESPGRVAQRRRTRKAIVEATMSLLAQGHDPSVNDIAAAADVSRRTVYMHYPTLDQLLLDATLGLMNLDIDDALRRFGSDDPVARITFLIVELYKDMEQTVPLGRRMIKLTVENPGEGSAPRRGHRRVGWIEWAVEPLRRPLGARRFEELVSMLSVVIGWESFIVLTDVRGLEPKAARRVTIRAAAALIEAAAGPAS